MFTSGSPASEEYLRYESSIFRRLSFPAAGLSLLLSLTNIWVLSEQPTKLLGPDYFMLLFWIMTTLGPCLAYIDFLALLAWLNSVVASASTPAPASEPAPELKYKDIRAKLARFFHNHNAQSVTIKLFTALILADVAWIFTFYTHYYKLAYVAAWLRIGICLVSSIPFRAEAPTITYCLLPGILFYMYNAFALTPELFSDCNAALCQFLNSVSQ
jgi:hypothetical protein